MHSGTNVTADNCTAVGCPIEDDVWCQNYIRAA